MIAAQGARRKWYKEEEGERLLSFFSSTTKLSCNIKFQQCSLLMITIYALKNLVRNEERKDCDFSVTERFYCQL